MSASPVTVVIPTYNSTAFLTPSIASVLAQTERPAEILIVDDGSTDGTPELVEALATDALVPIRLIRSACNSGGPARPLNQGIAAAQSDLIATLDHDDLMHPRRLERQAECFSRWPGLGLALVRCTAPGGLGLYAEIDLWQRGVLERLRAPEPGGPFYRLSRQATYDCLTETCFSLSCSNMMFARRSWEVLGGFDEALRWSGDYDFVCKVARDLEIAYVDEVLTQWTPRADSHYRAARELDRVREMIRIVTAMRPAGLSVVGRAGRAERLRDGHLNAAYLGREVGEYWSAVRSYLSSIRWGGLSAEALWGLLKLGPHRALRLVRAGRVPQS